MTLASFFCERWGLPIVELSGVFSEDFSNQTDFPSRRMSESEKELDEIFQSLCDEEDRDDQIHIFWVEEIRKDPLAIFKLAESEQTFSHWMVALAGEPKLIAFLPDEFCTKQHERMRIDFGRKLVESSSLLKTEEREEIDKILRRIEDNESLSSGASSCSTTSKESLAENEDDPMEDE